VGHEVTFIQGDDVPFATTQVPAGTPVVVGEVFVHVTLLPATQVFFCTGTEVTVDAQVVVMKLGVEGAG
jgi:hypothetical protein